jgi:cytochrome d ubiquinol oxidase subunit II
MGLADLWFVLIAVLWIGFFVLEGFDFGVGMLHTVVGKRDTERRIAINAIGPFWDGNEVWLITAGAAIFAAFPAWYATMFSALYLALVLLIVALMGRGVSFEYRGKGKSNRWRDTWSWVLTASSAVIPLLIGVALGDLLHGLPIDKAGNYTGDFLDLLTPYGLWIGITVLALCVLHGAAFLTLKTSGSVRERSRALLLRAVWPVALVVLIHAIWTQVAYGHSVLGAVLRIVAVLAILAVFWLARGGGDLPAFAANAVAIAAVPASIFADLYPNVMVSSTSAAYNLTVTNSAAGHYGLQVMSIVALIFLPIVLLYQAWSYYVFRKRISMPPETPRLAIAGRAADSNPATGVEAPSRAAPGDGA